MTKQSLQNTLSRVYQSSPENALQQDLYTIFMISAISSVTMFRRGMIGQHPYGFYRSASRLLSSIPLVGSLQAIQNLLLIARFAMYYHIGTLNPWSTQDLLITVRVLYLGYHSTVYEAVYRTRPPPSSLGTVACNGRTATPQCLLGLLCP